MKNAIRKEWRSRLVGKRFHFSGFTLVELIVVIAILAILSTIGMLALSGYTSDARNSARVTDIDSISKAAEIAATVQGKYPDPAQAVTLTGGSFGNAIFKQGIANSTVLRDLSARFGDPSGSGAYTYSVLADGSAYQVSAEYEGKTSSVMAETAYAATKTAYVQGNYQADPSLPSLIVVPGSIPSSASGGIFSSNVCFVTNGASNVPSGSPLDCVPKNAASLASLDSSLIWYWDMESYYQTTYASTPNVVFLKDLSGNGYDMYGKVGNASPVFLTNPVLPAGNMLDSSGSNLGIKFASGSYNLSFGTIDTAFTSGWRTVNPIPKDAFFTNVTASGSKLIPWITFESRVSYDRTLWATWGVKRIISWAKNNTGNIDAGDVMKAIDSSPLRVTWVHQLHSYVVPYNYGASGVAYWVNGLTGCWGLGCDASQNVKVTDASFSGELLLDAVFNFDSKTICTYVNGTSFNCVPLTSATIQRLQEAGYKNTILNLSSSLEPFAWTIQSVSAFSRTLPDSEIRQHAKAAGF